VTAQVGPFELLGRGSVDIDDAAARIVDAVDQFEERRLAATGGTDEDNEFARLDRQRDLNNGGTRLLPVVKPLGDVIEPDLGRCVGSAGERLLLVLDGAPPFRVGSRESGVDDAAKRVTGSKWGLHVTPVQTAPTWPIW